MTSPRTHARFRRDERGVIGGAEGLLFGMLILVAGSIVIINAWAVLDTRMALDSAAREYLRSYTEQDDAARALAAGDHAARELLGQRGNRLDRVTITPIDTNGFGPCASAGVQVSTTVPWIRVPFVGSFADTELRITRSELVDAHREVTSSDGYDPLDTICAGS